MSYRIKSFLCSTWNMIKTMFNSRYDEAFDVLMQHEGGYVDHPVDDGGPTNYGLSQRFLQSIQQDSDLIPNNVHIDKTFVKTISRKTAKKLYKQFFWDRYRYSKIAHDLVAIKLFDIAINIGPQNAHRQLQIALNKMRKKPISIDGILGEETLYEITLHDQMEIIKMFIEQMEHYYINLIADNPKFEAFKSGWMKRARWPLTKSEVNK